MTAPEQQNGPDATNAEATPKSLPSSPLHGTKPMTYEEVIPFYTWGGLLPVPANAKAPVPAGYTGNDGKFPDIDDELDWAAYRGNFALRLPDGVLAIDTDEYTKGKTTKHGAEQLAAMEEALGVLPPTWMASGRGYDPSGFSGHRFYRYPGGKRKANPLPGVELLQRHHRYSVVWPSRTRIADGSDADRTYEWYTPDGQLADRPPLLEELAELPAAWDQWLSEGAATTYATADGSTLLDALMADVATPCDHLQQKADAAVSKIKETHETGDGRHDIMLHGIFAVVMEWAQGHIGGAQAVEQVRSAFLDVVGADRDAEFERSLSGAADKAEGTHALADRVAHAPGSCGAADYEDEGEEGADYDMPTPTGDTEAFEKGVDRELNRLRVRDEAHRRHRLEVEGERKPFDVVSLGVLMSEGDTTPRWAIGDPSNPHKGVLPEEGSLLLTAQRKVGKTTAVANLLQALLTGSAFLGRYPVHRESAKAAFLNYEVSRGMMGRWLSEAGVPSDRCLVVNLRGCRNPLGSEEDRIDLGQQLRAAGVDLLVVDPFANAFTGDDQNSASQAKRFLNELDRFAYDYVGARNVILTNHAGWNAGRTRGSSALEDWADELMLMTADERGARRIQLVDGRDSSDMDGFLDFDEPTRRLIYRDARQVLDQAHREEMDNAAEAALAAIEQTPGLSQNSLEAALKNRGDGIGTPRLKAAVEYLIGTGRVHVQAQGRGFAHYPGPSEEFLALQAK